MVPRGGDRSLVALLSHQGARSPVDPPLRVRRKVRAQGVGIRFSERIEGGQQGLLGDVASTAANHLQQIDLSRQLQRGVLVQVETGWEGRLQNHRISGGRCSMWQRLGGASQDHHPEHAPEFICLALKLAKSLSPEAHDTAVMQGEEDSVARPEGRATRGKTAQNRLRRIDLFVSSYASGLLRSRGPAPVVDLGFGRLPLTTLEMAASFRRHNPRLPVLGIEIDPERVAAAQAYAGPDTQFMLGGFNLPQRSTPARLIRAMNVLRQYPEEEALPAHRQLIEQLIPGGLLVEGTSSPFGRRIVINLFRRGPSGSVELNGLLFSINFREGFTPDLFPPVLPKQLIHRHVPGEAIYAFFECWRRCADRARHALAFGVRQHFVQTARALALTYPSVSTRPRLLRQGFLFWRQPPYP